MGVFIYCLSTGPTGALEVPWKFHENWWEFHEKWWELNGKWWEFNEFPIVAYYSKHSGLNSIVPIMFSFRAQGERGLDRNLPLKSVSTWKGTKYVKMAETEVTKNHLTKAETSNLSRTMVINECTVRGWPWWDCIQVILNLIAFSKPHSKPTNATHTGIRRSLWEHFSNNDANVVQESRIIPGVNLSLCTCVHYRHPMQGRHWSP